MKLRPLITAAVLVAGSAGATDVGVSVSVGDSGFYGRIDVGHDAEAASGGLFPAGRRRVGAGGGPASADLPPRPARTRQALAQALPRIQRLRRASPLRPGGLVHRVLRARREAQRVEPAEHHGHDGTRQRTRTRARTRQRTGEQDG